MEAKSLRPLLFGWQIRFPANYWNDGIKNSRSLSLKISMQSAGAGLKISLIQVVVWHG
jgi:hypothetical protein